MVFVIVVLVLVPLVWYAIQLAPRLARRHPAADTTKGPVRVVLDKRYVDPVPGDTSGRPQRFQLLLEDEDGRQVWTWCEADVFSSAESGDTYRQGTLIKH